MKRLFRKRLLIAAAGVLLLAALLFACSAAADGLKPAGGLKGRQIPAEGEQLPENSPYRSMKGYGDLSGPGTGVTGRKYSWTFGDYEPHVYDFYMCVLDGTYASPYTADVQYYVRQDSSRLTYTFYFPGTYLLFCDVYETWTDDDGGEQLSWIGSDSFTIEVSDGGENAVTRQIKAVAKAQKAAGDELQTVLNLHDWVIDHCTYDYTYTWYSADSVFLLGTGVCNSYARAFTLLLKEAGIASRRVSGYAFGDPDAGHAWNAVRINGRWYLFDLTWDDSGDTAVPFDRYQYFAVPDSAFSIEHTAGHYTGGTVNCRSLKENYYFCHHELWEDLTADTFAEYAEYRDGGMHSFVLDFTYEEGSNDYREYLLGEVTAAYLGSNPPPDAGGRILKGTFEYDDVNRLIHGRHNHLGTLTLPASLRTVPAGLFANTPATCVLVPEGCGSVCSGAFDGMDLWEIRIPGAGTHIEPGALPENPESVVILLAPEGSEARDFAAAHPDRYIGDWYEN